MLITQYIQYLTNQKRYSVHSLVSYQKDLIQYEEYVKKAYTDETELTSMTSLMIRSWIKELIDHKLSHTSINRKLSALKSFYKYLLINKIIDKNPASSITALKTPKRLPSFVEKSKMVSLCNKLAENSNHIGNFQLKRDQLLIEMFYQCGLRLSELINIKVKDIDFNRKEIKIHGKGNKDRMIPLSPSLLALINEYLLFVNEEFKNKFDHLFLTNIGEKLYPKFAYRIVNFYLENTTTLKKKSPHVLRHTFATHLLNNGADLNAIKELLGHANLSSTQVYTHNSITQLTNIYKQAHPRA